MMTNKIKNSQIKYSVVIPAYNERENVVPLHKNLVRVMDSLDEPYEIVFVNDGSTDGTLEVLETLNPVKIINLRKNCGQTAALDAGFKAAQGEIVITLDADLQNDPNDIPRLIRKMVLEDLDVVSGWRYNRQDSLTKKLTSRGANLLRQILVEDGIHDSGCTLKAYRRECLEDLELYSDMHRFIPGILKSQGYKIGEVKVNHQARVNGHSKYGLDRVMKGFVDMLYIWFWRKFAARPVHVFGALGLVLAIAGGVLGLSLALLRVFEIMSLQGKIWPLVSVFLVLAGFQFFVSGILADMGIKTYFKTNGVRGYSVKEVVENC